MTDLRFRRMQDPDMDEVLNIIHRNSLEINSKDYGIEPMKKFVAMADRKWLSDRASFCHMYVAEQDGRIVGVGGIASYFGSADESILLTIFVLPECHGKGIGRQIVSTLENDEYGLRANRIEVPASATALEFYRKLGYDYKDGVREMDKEHHYRLEKKK